MPNFDYVATHDDGRTIRGSAAGATIQEVIQELALKGMLVTKIEPARSINDPIPSSFTPGQEQRRQEVPAVSQTNPYNSPRIEISEQDYEETPVDYADRRSYFATSVAGPLVGKVPLDDLQMFFRQFAAMHAAGVPHIQTFSTLAKQTRNPKLSRIIAEMEGVAQQGGPASGVMQRYPEVFSVMMISLVRVGEEAGGLQKSLVQVADYIATEIEIRTLYRKATLYPKLVIASSIVVVLGANAVISMLGLHGGLSSPLTTLSVVIVVVPLLVAAFLYFRVGLANPRIRYNWDAFTLRIPYLGVTIRDFAMVKFGRAFGALHGGGVSVGRALKLSADACGNEYIRSKIYPAAKKLDQGDGIAGTLAETGVVSPIVLDMLQTGELSGSVDAMLSRAAEHYEAEAKMRSNQLAVVSGVFFLLLVAIYVGYVVINAFIGISSPVINESRQTTEVIRGISVISEK